ncbi:hypothetical protein ES703_97442 [subsurface metagenome]
MKNWITSILDWIAPMSESRLNNRIEDTKKEIDWLTELIPIAHIMNSPTENGLKARRDNAKHRLSKLLKKKQEKEKLHDK